MKSLWLFATLAFVIVGLAVVSRGSEGAPGVLTLSIDADPTNGTRPCSPVDTSATVPLNTTHTVAVCLSDYLTNFGSPNAFEARVQYSNLETVPEVADAGVAVDDNPDANNTAGPNGIGAAGWDCTGFGLGLPKGDDPLTPGVLDAFITCYNSANSGALTGEPGHLATITLQSGAVAGANVMSFLDSSNIYAINCPTSVDLACEGATITIGSASTNTATATAAASTATATRTPTATSTATIPANTATSTSTATRTPTATNTTVANTATSTPTATNTTVGNTATSTPTATNTTVGNTATSTPTATNTTVANTATSTPTATNTTVGNTATSTPTATNTTVVNTATSTPTATNTTVANTATSTPTATSTTVGNNTATATTTRTPTHTPTPRPQDCLTLSQKVFLLHGILRHFGARHGSWKYDARFDVNHDGRIDAKDFYKVLSTRTCRVVRTHG